MKEFVIILVSIVAGGFFVTYLIYLILGLLAAVLEGVQTLTDYFGGNK